MNNSNELSTKLVQSLPTECKQAVEKYGGQYALFLDKYPTLQIEQMQLHLYMIL